MSSNLSLIEASLTFWNFSSRSLTSLSTIRLNPKNDECTLNDGNNDYNNNNNNNNNNNDDVNSDVDDDNNDDCFVRQRLN